MSVQLEPTHVGPFAAVTLSNDAMMLVVIPQLGGKIVSLASRRTGREWLWKNPYLPLVQPPQGATDFGQFDAGGWDEIFPTVNPCRVPDSAWGDRTLTDHGELWYRPWTTLVSTISPNESAMLTLAVDDLALPFRFERTLTLAPGVGSLTASYKLTNCADLPLASIWAAHPLVAIEPGDSIRLPAGTRMTSTGSVGLELAAGTTSFNWPLLRLATGEMLDVSRVPAANAGIAMKLFTQVSSPNFVEIVDRTETNFLRFAFAPDEVPHVGLWLNYGGWSGANTMPYFNAGLEPTTAPHDDLNVAAQEKSSLLLAPGETRHWQLAVTVS